MAILVVVCGKICGKMCGKMCGKIEKLSDWNRNWYGSKKQTNSVQGVGGAVAGGYRWGPPIKKMGSQFFFYSPSGGRMPPALHSS